MQRLKVNALKTLMWFDDSTNLATESVASRNFFDETLRDYKGRLRNQVYGRGPCRWAYYALPPDRQGMSFYPYKTSAIFICVAPYSGNEQRRFEDNFRRAANNLKKHSQTQEENNLILFGLPPSVSISQATEWLVRKFSSEYKSVGAVLLTRKVPVVSLDRRSTYVSIECALVSNPESSRKLEYGLELQLPIGVLETEEPKTAFVVDDKVRFETGSCYHFQKGQIFYHDIAQRRRYHCSRIPGVDVTVVMEPFPGERVGYRPIHPPTDDLVLL